MSAIYAVPTQDFLQKTLQAQLLTGTTSAATLNNVTGIQNLPGIMVIDRVDANGAETPSKREVIAFSSTSGSTVVTLTRGLGGTSDQDHAVGAIVEFSPDVVWAQSIYDALTKTVVASTGLLDATKVVDLSSTQMLFNKMATGATLASPTINSASIRGATLASLPVFADQPRLMAGSLTPFVTLSDASTMYMDFSLGNKWIATIVPSASRTFAATNATLGSVGILRVKYASTASLALNLLTTNATISWPAGSPPTPTATVNKADMFGFVCVGTFPNFDGITIGQNI